MKGKRKEILREELHQRLKKASVLIKFIRNTEWQNCFLKPTLQVIKLLKTPLDASLHKRYLQSFACIQYA